MLESFTLVTFFYPDIGLLGLTSVTSSLNCTFVRPVAFLSGRRGLSHSEVIKVNGEPGSADTARLVLFELIFLLRWFPPSSILVMMSLTLALLYSICLVALGELF